MTRANHGAKAIIILIGLGFVTVTPSGIAHTKSTLYAKKAKSKKKPGRREKKLRKRLRRKT